MSFENTVTEHDLEATTPAFAPARSRDSSDFEPDLDVDGLSNSVLSRLLGLFGSGSR